MFMPEHDIEVFYYRLKNDSPKYAEALSIHQDVCDFVKKAQVYADSKGADSWSYTIDRLAYADNNIGHNWSGYRLSSLSYVDEDDVPNDWVMDTFGRFIPTAQSNDQDGFYNVVSPARSLKTDDGVAVRFHVFKDQIILAVRPDAEGKRRPIADSEPLEESILDVLKLEATPDEMAGFSLNHYHQSPLDQASVLYNKPLSQERDEKLRAVEHVRFHDIHRRNYVPNPTTGIRGLMRKAFG